MSVSETQAMGLLDEFTRSSSLRRHALAVAAAMAAYAERFGEDAGRWRACGLLHDFDYERFPDRHPAEGEKILAARGIDEPMRQAILGHAGAAQRTSLMAKTLFAVDELCGFLMACALVRPDRSLGGIEARSVRKKLKDKRFAAQVSRAEIMLGAEELEVDLDEHIVFVARALSAVAADLELQP